MQIKNNITGITTDANQGNHQEMFLRSGNDCPRENYSDKTDHVDDEPTETVSKDMPEIHFNGEQIEDEYSLLLNTIDELDNHLESLATAGQQREQEGRDASSIEEELVRLGHSAGLRTPDNYDLGVAEIAEQSPDVKRVTLKNNFQGEINDPDLFSSLIGKALGVSSRIKVFLPNACCWVSVTTPSSTAIKTFGYKFLSAIEEERLSTYGIPYQVSQAKVFKYAAEFAIKLVVDTNIIKPLSEVVNLKTLSKVDVEILLIAILASRHTAGTDLNVECVVCNTKGSVRIDLTDTVRYALPEELKDSEAYKSVAPSSVSSKDHDRALQIVNGLVDTYQISDTISIDLFTPSIHEWNERSELISDYIIGLLEESVTNEEDDDTELLTERIQQLMLENLGAISLLLYTKAMRLFTPEETFTTNVDGILRALEDLNEDPDYKSTLIETAHEWIQQEPLATHVLYPHTCTNHKSEAKDYEPVTTSVLNFFIMKLQTLMQVPE